MFAIGKNFHVIHMTDDLQALDAWYDDVFAVHRFMMPGYLEAEKRDASLVLVGDFCIEPLAPSFRVEGWDEKPLGRFYQRLGKRWHSIAWYMEEEDGMTELYRSLRDAGVRLYGTGGVPQTGDEPTGALFTHPRDTYTQLEFWVGPRRWDAGPRARVPADQYVDFHAMPDPRFQPGFDPAWWSNHHPLQIVNASHVTLAVRDVEKARDLYVKFFGGQLLHEGPVDVLGSRSAFVAVGHDLVVELATPATPDSVLTADLDRYHESLFAVTFKVRDLDAVRRHLTSKGVGAAVDDGTTLLTDPATTHGVVMGFTTWSIPSDPRRDWDSPVGG